jgi:hypothetical protein
MKERTKIIIGILAVAVALTAAVNSASARRIEISEQRFLVLFKELTFSAGGSDIVCEVNLEGSFHSRTVSKMSGQLIGYITEAVIHRPCPRGAMWTLNGIERGAEHQTLPWHILYLRFLGLLPNITGIEVQLNNGGFVVEPGGGLTCLYEATRANGMRALITVAREPGGRLQATRLDPIKEAQIRRREGSFLCPVELVLLGEGRIGTQLRWELIFVRLVV